MPIQQCLCYPILKPADMSYDELFRHGARIGYKAVECWGRGNDFEEVAATAKQHKLVVASFVGHASLNEGMNKPENHERIEKEIRDSLDIAVKHNVPGMICFSGRRNHGQSDYEGMVECARCLRRVAKAAEDKGVNLNIELLNSRVDHPGYQCDHTDWGVALCEMVASPRVKLLYDIYHMQIMEGDLIRTIRKSIRHIGHFHTAGNPGRNELDDRQELNYRGISAAISASGYNLYVGHELKPTGNVIAAIEQAFNTCNVP